MTRTNKTRSALFTSILSLLLCVSMLVGTTFAWFTDVAQSSGNKIQAGNLQVELWEGETNISNTKTPIFNHSNWEPGYSDYADLTIKNAGSLALKYQMTFQSIETTGDADITKVLDVYVGDTKVGTLNELGTAGVLAEGHLLANTSVALDRIKVVMQTTAGNQYQGCGVTFDVVVRAIQYNHENDGFGNPDYDINADGNPDHPEFNFSITGVNTTVTVPADNTGNYVYTNGDNTVTVTIPNATASAKYDIVVKPTADNSTTPVAANQGALSFDISVKNAEGNDVPATIVLDVEKNMPNVKVFHNGTEMASENYTYNATNGKLTINATSYSIYTVRYEYVAEVKGHTYGTLQEAFDAAQNGDTVNLLTNITTDASKITEQDRLTVSKDLTLNLGAYTITVPAELEPTNNWMAINISAGTLTVNATTGGITSGTSEKDGVYCFNIAGTGKLVINGGNYFGGVTVAQISSAAQEGASITVNGGTFKVGNIGGSYGSKYLLNHGDAFYNVYGNSITVTGGTFYDFNPAEVYSEVEQPISYLADGYKTTANNGVYTVGMADYYMEDENTYVIQTPAGLTDFAQSVNSGNSYSGKTVKLGCNIDLNNVKWEPIGQTDGSNPVAFFGSFDGQNYTISNLMVNSDAQTSEHYASGFFGFLDSRATVKNIKFDNANVKGHHYVAVVCGYFASGNLENCHVTNATIVNTHYNSAACGDKTGVIVGYTYGGVNNCSAKDCTITVDGRDAGQIAGAAKEAEVTGCTATNVTVTLVEEPTCNHDSLQSGGNVREAVVGRPLS